jgi:hypothetical protein
MRYVKDEKKWTAQAPSRTASGMASASVRKRLPRAATYGKVSDGPEPGRHGRFWGVTACHQDQAEGPLVWTEFATRRGEALCGLTPMGYNAAPAGTGHQGGSTPTAHRPRESARWHATTARNADRMGTDP